MTKRFYAKYLNEKSVHLIISLGFVFGLSISLLAYISSTYFKQVMDSDNVGIFYIISFSLILFVLFELNKFIERIGRARTLMLVLFLQIGILFILQFIGINILGSFLMMLYLVGSTIVWVLFDIVLEAYSRDGNTGRIRGLFLSVWNLGILAGPLLSVYILEYYGFEGVFFVTMVLYVIMFLTVFMALNDINGHVKKQNMSITQVVRIFKSRPCLIRSYWISFTLRFFYAVMTVFMPLYLLKIGLNWVEIGIVFTIMLIPFVIVEYPAGILADKKYGEKEMLFLGLVIIISSVIIIYFAQDVSLAFWAMMLFVSRVGAALLETMQDSYFYKHINKNDVALINFFRSTRATAYIISSIFSGAVLYFFGNIRYVFIVLLIVLIVGLYPIVTLKDTK